MSVFTSYVAPWGSPRELLELTGMGLARSRRCWFVGVPREPSAMARYAKLRRVKRRESFSALMTALINTNLSRARARYIYYAIMRPLTLDEAQLSMAPHWSLLVVSVRVERCVKAVNSPICREGNYTPSVQSYAFCIFIQNTLFQCRQRS